MDKTGEWVEDLDRLREFQRRIVLEWERNIVQQKELISEVEAYGADASQFKALHLRHERKFISIVEAEADSGSDEGRSR